jgi:hypothetical protein
MLSRNKLGWKQNARYASTQLISGLCAADVCHVGNSHGFIRLRSNLLLDVNKDAGHAGSVGQQKVHESVQGRIQGYAVFLGYCLKFHPSYFKVLDPPLQFHILQISKLK